MSLALFGPSSPRAIKPPSIEGSSPRCSRLDAAWSVSSAHPLRDEPETTSQTQGMSFGQSLDGICRLLERMCPSDPPGTSETQVNGPHALWLRSRLSLIHISE